MRIGDRAALVVCAGLVACSQVAPPVDAGRDIAPVRDVLVEAPAPTDAGAAPDVPPDVAADVPADVASEEPADAVVPCADGLARCGDACVNLATDPAHCGGCAAACPVPIHAAATCAGGACGFVCDRGYATLRDYCAPPFERILDVAATTDLGTAYPIPPALSADGRFVAFASRSDALVPGDTNGAVDVFLYDRRTGVTTRVSVGPSGAEATGLRGSADPAISADGRFVAFSSGAPDLVAGDTNGADDVFVRDVAAGVTTRVSVASSGAQGLQYSARPSLSADGRFVAFESRASNLATRDVNVGSDVFVHDRVTGATVCASVDPAGATGDAPSMAPGLSADGRFVAFASDARNLAPGDTNAGRDGFVRDLAASSTVRVSLTAAGAQAPAANPTNPLYAALSADGRFVAFQWGSGLAPDDTNGATDVYLRDTATGALVRASLGPDGAQGDRDSRRPAISADGRVVAFESASSNFAEGDANGRYDVFVRYTATGRTVRVSVDAAEAPSDDNSYVPALSADGRFVAFVSYATNLAPGDANRLPDLFVRMLP